ncbi:CBS domain-containing protein [Mycolicibacterium diernhoferi]|uniref:CBS domain-containing protein n=1 Tax=Mycolicibacterium diernhoferi TaxID=1801 RepID=A0A1Q4HLI5_9MYCO|nr:CBS domain-containing protein [Mycolicibacterium diernhoferi]OJZ68345.1 histidine kinase [Mycolicibacterium diernhoferi]OPE55265.1 histidine kinase [Mycolicibacterium diernhoferi]PEG51329.1 CBS domain-containing protein [Mycolicibacterium diernhoferi]QYL21154.1 CBS domain-containing protein [Mycolicibacterium diernhoferi]
MRIADVLKAKGAAVTTTTPDTSVAVFLAGLVDRNIGAMVVVGPEGPVGIVSERDVVHKLHELGADLLTRPVSEIMTKHLVFCSPEDTVDSLSAAMTHNRVRHIPVIADGRLAGIVSIGDVVKTRMQELESSTEHLQAYITQG